MVSRDHPYIFGVPIGFVLDQLLLLLQAVLVLMTLAVLTIAYRSYRRSGEPFLGWIFLGFVAIGSGAFADDVGRRFVLDQTVAATAETVLFLAGFGFILFALRR